jgi:hypothetical protein
VSPFAWIRLIGEAIGLVERVVPLVRSAATEPVDALAAKRGQAAGAAAQASSAATSERQRIRDTLRSQ